MDQPVHSVGAVPPHLLRNVSVNVQREGRRMMAQVLLHCLDVIPTLKGGHGVAVSQIVEAENEVILVEVENRT